MSDEERSEARKNGAMVGASTGAAGGAAIGAAAFSWTGPGAIVAGLVGAVIGGVVGGVSGAGIGGAIYENAEAQRELDLQVAEKEAEETTEQVEALAPWLGLAVLVVAFGFGVWLLRRRK
jgi:hypothetical protein